MHSVTGAERLKFTGGATLATARIEDVASELEAARCRTIEHNHTIQFQYPDARCGSEHLTYVYYHASLIYSHRVLSDYASSEEPYSLFWRFHFGSPRPPYEEDIFRSRSGLATPCCRDRESGRVGQTECNRTSTVRSDSGDW
ncbi:hypothetical protein BDV29DRAFT_137247 [Aspergillus leporis]|uniref:Uncharacterized protein n=1 Tax=Aspergillus leporis TaxID=41062 RepID=A0A5N5XEQ5_9EURO|nr:hypothetical protein BDV29DRAFT_137247 [Aspergillus leporis]